MLLPTFPLSGSASPSYTKLIKSSEQCFPIPIAITIHAAVWCCTLAAGPSIDGGISSKTDA